MEYANSLYLRDLAGQKEFKANIPKDLTLKINILTMKYRPVCDYSGCIVGFRWYEAKVP